ncbi:MAG: histidine kinase [Erythrobacter sp.]|nr:histidine kinase [Erythrobacter sp.]MBA4080673.1 histidine kinase [Erythrobacter sp.]
MTASETISRLTAREKEVLRAWLAHKSAKEIALDLGITHHAVEKRLKMARTKLGAATSLEAARMLAAVEGYGQTVTAPPAVSASPSLLPSRRYRPFVLGGIAMSLSLILALALAPASPLAPDDERAVAAAAAAASAAAAPIEIEIDSDLGKLFAHHDTNQSGFLESPESPIVEIAFIDDTGPEPVDGAAAIGGGAAPDQIAEFYATADTDGDDRISLAEFTGWSKARWAEMGIEVKTIVKVLPAPQS